MQYYCSGNSTPIRDSIDTERSLRKDSDHSNNKLHEIENTLGILGSLIEEHRREEYVKLNNEKGARNTEIEMDMEVERAGKRKKEISSPEEERNVAEEDNDNTRLVKRTNTRRSKIDKLTYLQDRFE